MCNNAVMQYVFEQGSLKKISCNSGLFQKFQYMDKINEFVMCRKLLEIEYAQLGESLIT